jgi:uncharacterized protein
VANSGGVDSTLLLKVASDGLGEDALAIIGTSPSLPGHEQEGAERIARELGAHYLVMEACEMEDPRYVANDARRCYYCRSALFGELTRYAESHGYTCVLDGEGCVTLDLSALRSGSLCGAKGATEAQPRN